jgi:hypothetical protein
MMVSELERVVARKLSDEAGYGGPVEGIDCIGDDCKETDEMYWMRLSRVAIKAITEVADAARVVIDRGAWAEQWDRMVSTVMQAGRSRSKKRTEDASRELTALWTMIEPFLAPSTSEDSDHGAE